jgi:dihydrodipicolinate synthase/N-acetylneuraminate lyase
MLMDGVHLPLTVPFTRDGAGYWKKLEANVRRYSLGPVAGLVALAGEALSDEEARETLRVVGQTAAAEKVLVAAVAKESVREALRLTEDAAAAGFDAVAVSVPRGLGEDEVRLYLRMVADASPLAVMLRDVPVALVGELATHPKVVGCYEAGLTVERYAELRAAVGEVKREVTVTQVFAPVTRRMVTPPDVSGLVVLQAVKTRVKTVGFQVMAAGRVAGLVSLLEAGVAGVMATLSACAPQGCFEAYAAFKDGDPALAAEKELRLAEADALMVELGVAGVKYGCDFNGYYGGVPRLPRLAVTMEQRLRVERVLAGIRN